MYSREDIIPVVAVRTEQKRDCIYDYTVYTIQYEVGLNCLSSLYTIQYIYVHYTYSTYTTVCV